jgi:hypothetical protein
MEFCAEDFATEVDATVGYVRDQMSGHGISY